jgi:hypothetical protein
MRKWKQKWITRGEPYPTNPDGFLAIRSLLRPFDTCIEVGDRGVVGRFPLHLESP